MTAPPTNADQNGVTNRTPGRGQERGMDAHETRRGWRETISWLAVAAGLTAIVLTFITPISSPTSDVETLPAVPPTGAPQPDPLPGLDPQVFTNLTWLVPFAFALAVFGLALAAFALGRKSMRLAAGALAANVMALLIPIVGFAFGYV